MKRYRVREGEAVELNKFDPADTSADDKAAASEKCRKNRKRLKQLQEVLYAEHLHKVLVVLQGMDTSGKDGVVRHVMHAFNPQGVRVSSFKKPSEMELDHDYLWRVHAQAPGKGEIVVFNRSHYEDVLVVRVHHLVPEQECENRFAQINEFERMLTENGTLILKFFLHISRDEQAKRLQARIDDPTKRWKFQHGDIAERALWDEYQHAYEDMLARTSTSWAPWYIVPSDSKWYRNLVVSSVIVNALEALDSKYPQPDLSKEVIIP